MQLAGGAVFEFTAGAPLTVEKPLAGGAVFEFDAGATLNADIQLAGGVTFEFTTGADLGVDKALTGGAVFGFTAAALLDVDKAMTGGSVFEFTAGGTLVADAVLAGGAVFEFAPGAGLTVEKRLAGGATFGFTSGGSIKDPRLAGGATFGFTAAAILAVAQRLAGGATFQFGSGGDLEADARLTGGAVFGFTAGAPLTVLKYVNWPVTPGAVNGAAVNAHAVNGDGISAERLAVPVRQVLYGEHRLAVPIQQLVYASEPDFNAASLYWSAQVFLGGEDISARLVGTVDIAAEEGMARTAVFRWHPEPGVVDPSAWQDLDVSIDYRLLSAAGAPLWIGRLFSGRVERPEYRVLDGELTMHCSDQMQRLIDGLGAAGLEALSPDAIEAERLLDNQANPGGWERLQNRLATLAGDADLDAFRQPRFTPWAAKAGADFTFDDDSAIDESYLIDLTPARDVLNEIDIEFSYGYQRLKERELDIGWTFPGDVCDFLTEPRSLPTRQMVRDALSRSGWIVKALSFEPLPPNGEYNCGGTTPISSWPRRRCGRRRYSVTAPSLPSATRSRSPSNTACGCWRRSRRPASARGRIRGGRVSGRRTTPPSGPSRRRRRTSRPASSGSARRRTWRATATTSRVTTGPPRTRPCGRLSPAPGATFSTRTGATRQPGTRCAGRTWT
ncbi:MAG: hypothetical protein U5P41_07190 [Gammaproteobacteria bacterium]|nr:hypothetical protein [Gammaproteobacteria bacterium]